MRPIAEDVCSSSSGEGNEHGSDNSWGSKPPHTYMTTAVLLTDTGFIAPKSGVMVMQWMRAAIHMYCLAFQQLEREVVNVRKITTIPLQRSVIEYLQHMCHAWTIMGICMDTLAWHAVRNGGCSSEVVEWFSRMPWTTDHGFTTRIIDTTLQLDNYPRMRDQPNALLSARYIIHALHLHCCM